MRIEVSLIDNLGTTGPYRLLISLHRLRLKFIGSIIGNVSASSSNELQRWRIVHTPESISKKKFFM